MNMNRVYLLALVFAVMAGCSDDTADKKKSTAEIERAAEMQRLLSQSEEFARQEQERKKQQIEAEERPLIIGVVGPETGEGASYGLSVAHGVLAAAKRFNARGGIGGKEIKVLHYDDQNNISFTNKIVSYLIEQRAIAIISAPTGSATFSAIHLINSSNTIFISVGSRRRIERSGAYVFRTAVPDELATEDLIKYASTELGLVNFALITSSNYGFSLDLSAMFKKALYKNNSLIKLEADTYDPFTGGDNMAVVIEAIKNSSDSLHGVIFTGGGSEAALLANGLEKAGLKLPIIGGEDLSSIDFLSAGKTVEGALLYSTMSLDGQSSKMSEFTEDYENFADAGKPDRFAALAYDTFMLVADAIEIAGSTSTSRVREAMINRENCVGVTGATRFSSEGSPIKRPLICKVKNGKSGGRVVVLKQ